MEVQAMGAATSEEWLKGLDTRGKERRSDAARWEKWEISGGVARMRSTEPHEAGGVVTNTNGFIPTTIATKLAQIPASANSHLPVSQGYAPGTQPPTQAVQPIHTNFRECRDVIPSTIHPIDFLLNLGICRNQYPHSIRLSFTKWICGISPSYLPTSKTRKNKRRSRRIESSSTIRN